MCCPLCKVENFSKLNNNDFNQYEQMSMCAQNNSKFYAQQKLIVYLSKKLGVCPKLLYSKLKKTINNQY